MKKPLVFAHIGDPHIEVADETNYRDLAAIAAALDALGGQVDFVVLPGDIANNGKPSEYELVTTALQGLRIKPIHAISGDHDMTRGSLDDFYGSLRLNGTAPPFLPYAAPLGKSGVTGLFLDMCERGSGQADFRLDPNPSVPPNRPFLVQQQIDWLRREVAASKQCIVFMHTYPADLADPLEQAAVVKILSAPQVLLVDIGHTHYNEIANDGRKLYAATRSTGQIQEGEVGYSITTVDDGIVSWRFRLLAADGPIVLITAPVDRRLAHRGSAVANGPCDLRVTVLSTRKTLACHYSIDGAAPVKMAGPGPHYSAALALGGNERFISVSVTDRKNGPTGMETIQLTRPEDLTIYRHADGSDADRIGRWSERGLLATQLGPNRNGKKW